MASVGFYHLTRFTLDQALPKLLQKVLSAKLRALVWAGSAERVAHLDALLWTFDPASWLPHGSRSSGEAAQQPVLLSDDGDNLNQATVLILLDSVRPATLDSYARVLVLFDGHDPVAVDEARSLWRDWKTTGHSLIYYQQTEAGGWEEKAKAGE